MPGRADGASVSWSASTTRSARSSCRHADLVQRGLDEVQECATLTHDVDHRRFPEQSRATRSDGATAPPLSAMRSPPMRTSYCRRWLRSTRVGFLVSMGQTRVTSGSRLEGPTSCLQSLRYGGPRAGQHDAISVSHGLAVQPLLELPVLSRQPGGLLQLPISVRPIPARTDPVR